MSKYNIGDKLNLQMIVDDESNYEHLGFWATFNKGNEEEGMWLTEEQLDKYSAKTYEQGLEDAWELARKISDIPTTQERADIFGFVRCGITVGDILRNMDYQEALAKLEAYEKGQEIKEGDVLKSRLNGTKCVVSKDKGSEGYILTFSDGSGSTMSLTYVKTNYIKTGKHIDISSILEQIGGDE